VGKFIECYWRFQFLLIPGFNPPIRNDRKDRQGGAEAIYVRHELHAIERQDLHTNGLESVWVELKASNRKCLVGGIYRPPNANNDYWQRIERTIDKVFNENCHNIVITGDFNMDFKANPNNKMARFIASYNAQQLIDTPTHCTERSNSLIDIFVIKIQNQVISSVVADPFIPDLVRFHCPVVCVLKFNKPCQGSYKRRI